MTYPIAFSQNALTTGLIVYRLLKQHMRSRGVGLAPNRDRLGLLDVARIIVESAALYTVEFLVLIVLHGLEINNAAQHVILSMVTPTIGELNKGRNKNNISIGLILMHRNRL